MKSQTSQTKNKQKELEAVLTGEDKPTKGASMNRDVESAPALTPESSEGSDSHEESGTVHERVFFHVLMVLVS